MGYFQLGAKKSQVPDYYTNTKVFVEKSRRVFLVFCEFSRYNEVKQGKEGQAMLEASTLGERLYDLRKKHGYNNTESLAKALDIPKSTLNHYENDEKNKSISYVNLVTLAKFYGVTTDFLLGATASDKESRCDVADLCLTDEAIIELKSKKLNSKLLCDLLTHDGFSVFLRNIEIYADDLASKPIEAFNKRLVYLHQEASKQALSPEEEKHLATLKASEVQADRYFKTIIYEGLDEILRDIKEKHSKNKKDPYNFLNTGKFSVNVREVMKGIENLEYSKKLQMINQLKLNANRLIEERNLEVLEENMEEKALRWICGIQAQVPEEMTKEQRETALKELRKYNKVWG